MPDLNNILSISTSTILRWGYWVIMCSSLIEATPFFGLVVPGQSIVIAGGFLAKAGILSLGYVFWISAIGAIIGDFFGFILGRKYGYAFIYRYGKYFFIRQKHYEKTKEMMTRYAKSALIMGRFNSLTRAFTPFVAGATGVRLPVFIISNVIGGLSWALVSVLAGYMIGAGYEVASKYIGAAFFIAVILSVFIIYAYRFIDKRRHIFTKYQLYTLFLNIMSLYMFSKMVDDVVGKKLITRLDSWVDHKIVSIWSTHLNSIMLYLTNLGRPSILFLLSAFLLLVLIHRKKWFHTFVLISSMFSAWLAVDLIKSIIKRPRPVNALVHIQGFSFPSGHATIAIIFFSFLIYAFKDKIKAKLLRDLFVAVNIVAFLLIGFSRIYLCVHWVSDVIAGFSLGLFLLTLVILILKAWQRVKT